MSDFPFKLGKKEARYVRGDLQFSDFRVASSPITVPSIFGHGNTFSDWGMLGNDQYGDCVWAGAAHETMNFANLGAGGRTGQQVVTFTPQGVLSDYSAVTGFKEGDPNSDQGTDVHQALDYRKNTGVIDSAGNRHKIAAYVAIEPGNLQHIHEALYLFDAVGIGFEVPQSAMDQYNENKIWQVVSGSSIDGGHYVPLTGVPHIGNLACITWGRRQVMTNQFFQTYCDEAYGIISHETLNSKTGKTYEGFDWQQLQAALAELSA